MENQIVDEEERKRVAAVKIQGLARGKSVRGSKVLDEKRELKAKREQGKVVQQKDEAVSANDEAEAERRRLAVVKIQGLARGKSVRKGDVMSKKREEKASREKAKKEQAMAAVQIQRHFRGFSLRNNMTAKDKEIQKMQFRERHETVTHVKPEELHRTAAQVKSDRETCLFLLRWMHF